MNRLRRVFVVSLAVGLLTGSAWSSERVAQLPCQVKKLFCAIKKGDRDLVWDLVSTVDPSLRYHFSWPLGFELLLCAVRSTNPFVMEDLLFEEHLLKKMHIRRYINDVDLRGDTPLHLALKVGNPRAAFYLLVYGDADPNVLDAYGRTALDVVLRRQKSDGLDAWTRTQYKRVHNVLLRCEAKTAQQLADQMSHENDCLC